MKNMVDPIRVLKCLVACCVVLGWSMPLAAEPHLEMASTGTEAVQRQASDRPHSIQAGIQKLVDKLVTDLKLTGDGTLTRVAVLPFETATTNEDEQHLGRVSAALVSSRLAAMPTIIQVERTRLDAVISELKRTETGDVNPKSAVSVGKLLGASNVVLGSVAPSGPELLITARVVNSETGEIVSVADHSFARRGFVALSEDVVEVKSTEGAVIRAAVLPGWGQFYNGEGSKGVVYTSAFVALALASTTTAMVGTESENKYKTNQRETVKFRQKANAQYRLTNHLLLTMAGVWALAVVDAYWNGRDATRIDLEPYEAGPLVFNGSF